MTRRATPRRPRGNSAALCSVLAASAFLATSCGTPEPPPVDPEQSRDCKVPIFFRPAEPLDKLPALVGTFNDWSGSGWELEDAGGGLYRRVFELPPGEHHYLIAAGGQRVLDPYNPLTSFPRSADEETSTIFVQDCSIPQLVVQEREQFEDGFRFELLFERARSNAPLSNVEVDGVDALEISTDPGTGAVTITKRGLDQGKHTITVRASDEEGVSVTPIDLNAWTEPAPFDWRDAVIYQVVVDRFARSEGEFVEGAPISFFHGGDLDGVTRQIEAGFFEDVGVNTIWLSPAYDNPEGVFIGRDGYEAQAYHGYWPRRPREVEPRIGGAEALHRLVDAAHARGMRVILDTVLNHVHEEHPYAMKADRPRWYNHPDGDCICGMTCSWGLFIESCWFDPFMPDLQLRNPDVMHVMVDDAVWWAKEFDLDGLRLDAVPMMPRAVMRHLRYRVDREIAAGGEHFYMLGETFTYKAEQDTIKYFLGPDALSGQFDFPVLWQIRDALAGRVPMTALAAEVERSEDAWDGSGAVMAPILGNHDVPRFISDVNGDVVFSPRDVQPPSPADPHAYELLVAGWVFIMSQPGAPVVYYGDEYGMPGANDPDNRRDMRGDDVLSARERGVKDALKRLIRARRCSAALRRGERVTAHAGLETFAQVRDAGDGYPAIAVLNRGEGEAVVEVELPVGTALAADAMPRDVLGAGVVSDGSRMSVTLPPRSGALIVSDPSCIE